MGEEGGRLTFGKFFGTRCGGLESEKEESIFQVRGVEWVEEIASLI